MELHHHKPHLPRSLAGDETHLRWRVGELQNTIASLQREIASLNEFSSRLSHDLNGPLSTIESFATILKEEYADELNDEAKQCLRLLHGGAIRSQHLIRQLRVLISLDKSEMDPEPIELSDVLEAASIVAQSQAGDIEICTKIGRLPTVIGCHSQLLMLFDAIFDNAVKYGCSPDRRRIYLNAERRQNAALISIRDLGPGLNESQLEKCFQPFRRFHSQSEVMGSGMGLPISQKIVERHRGTIHLRSQPNQGVTVSIILPSDDLK